MIFKYPAFLFLFVPAIAIYVYFSFHKNNSFNSLSKSIMDENLGFEKRQCTPFKGDKFNGVDHYRANYYYTCSASVGKG